MVKTEKSLIEEVLTRGVEKIYPGREALEKELKSGRRIKLYCGYDGSGPSLHVGHAITLHKLAQFQELGHEVVMLIGDFTGMIGDPTDKMAARAKLTRKEVLANAANYKKMAGKILKFSGENPAQILYNSEWNDKLTFVDLIELASNFTVQQMSVRDMFQKRIEQGKPIYLHEFLYPLAQAYDSVVLDIDLEVGGNDQTFNMLCGRDLMKVLKNKEKFVLTAKLLTDRIGKKMGKSEGNIVALDDTPENMFGKIMSWPDELIALGLELCTDIPLEEIKKLDKQMKENKINPRDVKAKLAREIISIHYDEKESLRAEREFEKIFKEKKLPSEMPEIRISESKLNILDLLMKTELISSKNEAKRLIEQGGIKINEELINDWEKEINIKDSMVIQIGKKKFIKVN